ncbi:peptidoglycan-binding domain-containing protein [Xinfangfangia sp. CPCC 101601]|uniref:Peptidoglycan-binding domain-containing protein n=1 Tax=Pseudogemmobacter lacusdianii TaxID=3069608 RepID=A0ABU0VVJ1_9RHOB|nr:peptidoglycan-binding domain-containing protein [Xinfangfangia sp. CPCC 101601]MDQ2065765.1 peptidoglycan-binding domain-containing protein [Xinfangfangia sp. CPCC 101601]
MFKSLLTASVLALALAGCIDTAGPLPVADFSAEMISRKDPGPPPGPKGACWQADIRPAVIETVTEQVMVKPERVLADGRIEPAVYGSSTRQRIVSDRGTVWFRAPCAAEMTPEFIATLQRALKARGFYLLPLTGVMDRPTRDALGRYQRSRGLDSDHLSLAGARELGLIAVDRSSL